MVRNIIRKKYLLGYLLLALAPILYVVLMNNSLPDTIVMYANLENIPNQEVSKNTYYYVAGLGSIFALVAMAIPYIGKHYKKEVKEIKSLMRFEVGVAIFIDIICIAMIHASARNYIGGKSISYIIMTVILILIPIITINLYSKSLKLPKNEGI